MPWSSALTKARSLAEPSWSESVTAMTLAAPSLTICMTLAIALVVAGVGVAVWFLAQRGQRLVPVRAAGVHAAGPQQHSSSSMAAEGPGPLTILDERLARGEIDVNTYRALRTELAPAAPPAPQDPQATRSMPPPG